jgi:hypothetical protein
MLQREKNILPLSGIEPRYFGRPARIARHCNRTDRVRQKSQVPPRCITAHHFRVLNWAAPFRSNNRYPCPRSDSVSLDTSPDTDGPRLLRAFRSARCLLGLLFSHEDGFSTFLRNVTELPNYRASHPRRQFSTPHLHNNDQPVNAVWGNSRCLL